MAESKNEELDEDVESYVKKSSWMIRPCEVYDREYSECKAIKSRFNQYFMNGKMSDCKPWLRNFHACRRWVTDYDLKAAARIIRNEKNRIEERKNSRIPNDVIKDREIRPPPNWNSSLAPHILEKQKNSYLMQHIDELMQPYDLPRKSDCSIL